MKKVDFERNNNAVIVEQAGNYLANSKKIIPVIIVVVIVFVVLIGLSSSYYTVEPEEKAVVLRLGKVIAIESSGLHFMLPFGIDKTYKIKTERIFKEEFGFKTSNSSSGRTTYDNSNRLDESLILTGDLNVSEIEWIVQYKVDDPVKFLFKIKDPVGTIRDISEAATRKIIGNANVTDVLTTERASLANAIQSEMQKSLKKYDIGVRIETYKFQDVNPPSKVKTAFNAVNEAEQQKESMIQNAKEQYNNQVPKARGEAKSTLQKAEGYAMERVNIAQGDANRFIALLNEYKKYPEVTRTRMYLETMERIYPKMKEIIIVDSDSSKTGVTPLLPLQTWEGGKKE
jgi:membrane protease subunit HflK